MGQAGSSGGRVEDRYFLQKVKLGQGSFGTVWRAVDRHNNNVVAIKQLDKATMPRRGVHRQDIEREIHMMKACPHPNITCLYDTFEDATSIYLALEYCDGGDFGDKVQERGMNLQEHEAADYVRQICAAISALHNRGICHRDIKPDNFMVMKTEDLKLSDFGLALFLPRGKLLVEKCGTPAFMAPEQHNLPKRSRGYGLPADVWAAGVSMYMVMFGGRHPFLTAGGGELDEKLLLQGALSFTDNNSKGFFGFGTARSEPRFSETARELCRRMVEPHPNHRISADDALRSPWFTQNCRRRAPPSSSSGPAAAAPAPARPPPPKASTPKAQPATPKAQESASASGWWGLGSMFPMAQSEPLPERKAPPQPAPNAGQYSQPFPNPAQRPPNSEVRLLKEENERMNARLREQQEREQQLIAHQEFEQNRRAALEEQLQMAQHQLQKQRTYSGGIDLPPPSPHYAVGRAGMETYSAPPDPRSSAASYPAAAASSARPVLLQPGTRCRYLSATLSGWTPAVVQKLNEAEGTFDLDVKTGATLDRISPLPDVGGRDAWPQGAWVSYESVSAGAWLPAVVISFNEGAGTYNLDVRDNAQVDRIRPRLGDRPSVPSGRGGADESAQEAAQPMQSQFVRKTSYEGTVRDSANGAPAAGPFRVSELEASASAPNPALRSIGEGSRCFVAENGPTSSAASWSPATVQEVDSQDGSFAIVTASGQRLNKVPSEMLRAPADAVSAWPPGTAVAYESTSLKAWLPAVVLSFNADQGTYNLDVRDGAAPERVRPR